jgi:fatty-acyl-CoA synthase
MLTRASGPSRASFHCWVDDRFETTTWRELARDAEAMTAGLRRAGVRPGANVATVLTNGPQVVRGILGVWLSGGVIVSLPVPARGVQMDEYAQQLTTICAQAHPTLFLVEERMLGLLPQGLPGGPRLRSWESFADSGRAYCTPPEEDGLAFVQYSSGSTTAPKGCMLTTRAITAQVELVFEMLEGRPGKDVTVSWLPLSHDMGMFGCLLTSWACDGHLYLSSPERFMFSPRTWFADLAEFGGHITAGTNTALHLAARAWRSGRLPGELQVKACIIGAERNEWDTIRLAVDTLGPYGLREEALMPAYGLAEATLAVTATPLRQKPQQVIVDAVALADSELREVAPEDPRAAHIVCAGTPQKGVELPGASTDVLSEISVRSPCLATGYMGDAQRTNEHFRDGAVQTGDLGFVRDGCLYPVGRIDDVISISGRKVYAREVENAVDSLKGVRRGCSTLIDRRDGGASRLTLLAELKEGHPDCQSLAAEAASVAMAKAAVALDACVFLEQGSLPKTPSGKIQRHRCRLMLDADRFEPLATIDLAR